MLSKLNLEGTQEGTKVHLYISSSTCCFVLLLLLLSVDNIYVWKDVLKVFLGFIYLFLLNQWLVRKVRHPIYIPTFSGSYVTFRKVETGGLEKERTQNKLENSSADQVSFKRFFILNQVDVIELFYELEEQLIFFKSKWMWKVKFP